MTPYHLIYTSRATVEVDDDVLRSIQDRASANNKKSGVTGLLLYGGGNFLQLLEGPISIIAALFEKVQQDPRHTDVRCVHFGRAPSYIYPEWSMGVLNVEDAGVGISHERLTAFFAEPATSSHECYKQAISVFEDFQAQLAGGVATTSAS
ncbi:MAG: BLUF domain-containing protein [Planctomycetes bacterium]|nr:BLUF domain-containing protein [Planctomycetota bacterium]